MIAAFALLVLGLALVVAEVFFPSMGILGLIAGGSILLGLIIAFEEGGMLAGWLLVVGIAVAVPVVLRGAFRVLPRLPFGRRMLLTGPATSPGAGLPDFRPLVGARGVAESDLKPGGNGRFGDERVSVVAVAGLVPRGTPLIVVAVDGPEIRVDVDASRDPVADPDPTPPL